IPTDNVDDAYVMRPRKWDTAMVQRFMVGLGPVSSVYDFLTFGILLFGFHAAPPEFRAGWFIESLATQTLVIFVIRTAGNPLGSRPSNQLLLGVAIAIAVGLGIVVSPAGDRIGFTPLPPVFFGILGLMVLTYLAIVELLKRRLYSSW